jgi:hypothetical protein
MWFRTTLPASLCALCALCGESSSAPPTITHLYPAGAKRGTTVEVTAAGAFDPWPVDVWASDAGVSVKPGKAKGTFTVTVARNAAAGVCWLRAHNADGASTLRPFIVGSLPEVAEVEPKDPKKPQLLAGACVVNGRLAKANEVDSFSIPLKKGQTLVASLEANRTLKSPMDGVLQIVAADGFVETQNNDFHGLDPQLAFAVPADGTYTVRVFAFPAAPDSNIRFAGGDAYVYRLTLTTGGFADYAFPMTATRLAGPVSVVGWNLPEFPSLALPRGDDAVVLSWEGAFANTVRVRREPHDVWSTLPPRLSPPFSVAGRLDKPGATAAFPITSQKGKALSVQVQSREFGLPLSPVVVVRDAGGTQLARAEPPALGSDTAVSFTPAADGLFTAEVSDLFAGGGRRFAFMLRVVPVEPDYELAVATDRFAVSPGKPTAVPVKVIRKNGFAKAVEVVAEGLPDGVTAKVEPPAGKEDPAVVTVSLTAQKACPSAAFRLVGRVAGDAALTRPVRFVPAPPDTAEATTHFWLTVRP